MPVRHEPVVIEPSDDLGHLVDDADLRDLLIRLVPCWHNLKVGAILHAFRLWGPQALFPEDVFPRPFTTRVLAGSDLGAILLDCRVFREWLPGEPSLLNLTPRGVAVRTFPVLNANNAGQPAHSDDLLAACAELGLSSQTRIFTPQDECCVADMVRWSVAQFDPGGELEWTGEALARFLAPATSWTNRYGESYSFDDVVRTLLGRAATQQTCLGTHVPYSLTCIHRVDGIYDILTADSRSDVACYLKALGATLAVRQSRSGLWDESWRASNVQLSSASDNSTNAVTATGHHLEWIALAPSWARPPHKNIAAAIEAAFEMTRRWSSLQCSEFYPQLSHLARALCLFKNKSAVECIG